MKNEKEIQSELIRRENLLRRMKNEPSFPSYYYNIMEIYISALKWVLEEV